MGDEDEYCEDDVIIIDNGTGMIKAGMSTQDRPTVFVPQIVGSYGSSINREAQRAYKFGVEASEFLIPTTERRGPERKDYRMSYPVENGIIESFDDMELLWEHVIERQLKKKASDHPVLITEPPYNPKPNREKMVETMFESFEVPALNISINGVLALLGSGRTTGLVLDSGEGVTHTIPIYDGFGLPYCINRLDLAGRDLNTLLGKLLATEGLCLTTSSEQHHIRCMKEQFCYVAQDPQNEFAQPATYKMPDGREIQLHDERWKCPEALFSPGVVGIESEGIAGIVWDSICRSEIDIRKNLSSNIVLSGGSTLFSGFPERLVKDLKRFAPSASHGSIRVVQARPEERQYAVWIGGQVSCSLRSMQEDQWMTIDDYDEYGAGFIHDKIAVKHS